MQKLDDLSFLGVECVYRYSVNVGGNKYRAAEVLRNNHKPLPYPHGYLESFC